jgi:hypothetical protein
MNKTSKSFIARVKTYLKKSELPYTRIPYTDNLLVMRSVGTHHYLLIQFYDMPESWFNDRKYFDIKIAYGNNYAQVTGDIERYLNGQ